MDETKLVMSTRMINGKAVTVDVCFNCQWGTNNETGVMGKMQDGKILSTEDWRKVCEQDSGKLLPIFNRRREQKARASGLDKGN